MRNSEQANQKKGDAGRIPLFHASVVELSSGASARSTAPNVLAVTGLRTPAWSGASISSPVGFPVCMANGPAFFGVFLSSHHRSPL